MKNSTMKASRMIIISLDAAGEPDLAYIKEMPNFRRFFERAALCPHVESVYPSLTYPAHAAIVTGCGLKQPVLLITFVFSPGGKSRTGFGREDLLREPRSMMRPQKRG